MNSPEPVTKRKVLDSVSILDAAVKDSTTSSTTTSRAIKRRRLSPPISTPALISILTSNNRLPSPKYRTITPPTSYTPHSLSDLISRIATFSLTTYLPKPNSLSPISCALLGWKNLGKERLECVSCLKGFIISSPATTTIGGWNSSIGKKLLLKWESELRESHEKNCPWKVRGCSRSLYKVKIDSRSIMLSELRDKALELDAVGLGKMRITSGDLSEEDGTALFDALISHKQVTTTEVSTSTTSTQPSTSTLSLSLTSIKLALFGWNLSPSSSPTLPILTCSLCTRQVLATSYLDLESTKTFNLITQHQHFCPFINTSNNDSTSTSSPSPSPSTSTSNTSLSPEVIPGWKMQLNVLLNRASQSKRNSWSNGEKLKLGTKELMLYVRELLGPKVKK